MDKEYQTTHSSADVRAHYAALAATYDDKANAACKRAYAELVRRVLGPAHRVLELGAGSSPLLNETEAALKVACDLSAAMLQARPQSMAGARLAADAQQMPCRDASFDGIFCVNMLEHTPAPRAVAQECARLLAPGGRFVAITPNGNVEWLLDLLERMRLKLPEGPHHFLTFAELKGLAREGFTLVESRRFLAFPAGPRFVVQTIDRLACGWGLFLYAVLEKRL